MDKRIAVHKQGFVVVASGGDVADSIHLNAAHVA